MVIHVYTDPGHGWAKVPRKLLTQLGIERDITPYSYQRGAFAYLEEDCDCTTLFAALEKHGIERKQRTHCAERASKIRSYASYAPLVSV